MSVELWQTTFNRKVRQGYRNKTHLELKPQKMKENFRIQSQTSGNRAVVVSWLLFWKVFYYKYVGFISKIQRKYISIFIREIKSYSYLTGTLNEEKSLCLPAKGNLHERCFFESFVQRLKSKCRGWWLETNLRKRKVLLMLTWLCTTK
jgi:hypothetical protein